MSETIEICTSSPKRLLTVSEVAVEYGFESTQKLYRLVREGVIPPGPVVRIGRQVRFNRGALERWLDAGGTALPGGWRREPLPPSETQQKEVRTCHVN